MVLEPKLVVSLEAEDAEFIGLETQAKTSGTEKIIKKRKETRFKRKKISQNSINRVFNGDGSDMVLE